MYISEIYNSAPTEHENLIQELTYQVLNQFNIPFQRVQTDQVITMEDCKLINETMDIDMVKTLFLCNRQKTKYYLFITKANKPFNTKIFSELLNTPRVSFASQEDLLEYLGVKIGAATIFGLLKNTTLDIEVVFDKDVTTLPYYGCSDGTTTNYLKIEIPFILNDFFSYLNKEVVVIDFIV